jgi:methyl-accepting chemotaxis protein
MVLRKMRIGSRLALGFGTILAVMMVVSIGATALGQKSRHELAQVLETSRVKEALAADMKVLVLEQSAVMRNIGLHSDVKSMQIDEDRARRLGAMYDEAIEKMTHVALSPNERAVVETLKKVDKEIDAPLNQAIGLATSFRGEESAQVILNEIDPVVQRTLFELNRLIDMQKKANVEATTAAMNVGDRLANTIYVAEAIAVVLAVLVAIALVRSITIPLAESVKVARAVAAGDLTTVVRVEGNDEAAELLEALRSMNQGLVQIVGQIRGGAESIAVGARQVAAGNQQLSSRTEEHASSLEETASTLEEFTTTVRQNAEHARQASALAGTASTTAQKGGEVVGKVVTTMQEVTASSKRISDIIAVIDGISFQTNILALNAAVEAARAGEQGRGFAVVASEVRSLAQRSAASAKEIRGLIEVSVGRVEAGARLVEQAGRTMDELVASVRKVAEIMTEIAAASHEQSSGIEQINKAITQMDNVVQMNASLVEEATAAATSMASQATELAYSVAQFRVDDSEAPAPAERLGAHAAEAPQPTALPRRSGDMRTAPLAPQRREPVLAAEHEEDWNEF